MVLSLTFYLCLILFKDLLNIKGFIAGYGKNIDWIQEYEHLIGRKLKVFTISDPHMIDMFEVIKISNKKTFLLISSKRE